MSQVGLPTPSGLRLAYGPTAVRGEGVNHEGESFIGTLSVEPLEEGRAVLLRYRAALENGAVVHTESTLLGVGPDGALCLWPVMSAQVRHFVHPLSRFSVPTSPPLPFGSST